MGAKQSRSRVQQNISQILLCHPQVLETPHSPPQVQSSPSQIPPRVQQPPRPEILPPVHQSPPTPPQLQQSSQNTPQIEQSLQDTPQLQQRLPRVPNVQFRVLIIGRANAGKTSILQRVCDTTESPEVYRVDSSGTREPVELKPTTERGQHNIDDEHVFTNHKGYVFHDSRGFESGSEEELRIVQEFVRRKSKEKRLRDRLHAIWYCIPMDNDRPSLDLKYFGNICPDKNVPVIAVFTKFDQFKRDIEMKLEDLQNDPSVDDQGHDPHVNLLEKVENVFGTEYKARLGGSSLFVRLEKMQKPGQRCTDLIEMTATSLSGNVVSLMLLAVQKDNLEPNIKQAVKW